MVEIYGGMLASFLLLELGLWSGMISNNGWDSSSMQGLNWLSGPNQIYKWF